MVALDALLALGIVLNVIKGLDRLLGAGWRRNVQSLFERATRRLDSARPIERLRVLASDRGQKRVLLVGLGEFFLAAAVDSAVDYMDGQLDDVGSWGVALLSAAIILILLILRFPALLDAPALMRWLVRDTEFRPFLRRLMWFSLVGLAIIGGYQGALWAAGHLAGVGDPFATVALSIDQVRVPTFLFGVALLIGAPAVVYYSVVTQLGWMAVLACVLARLGARLLGALGTIARAIDAYNTGRRAAVTLAATIVLGIFKLMHE